jgi:Na+/melibiose symporter-like transporter
MLPWFTHIVPERRRGEFLAKDQSAVAFSSIVSLLIFGFILLGGHAWYSFGIVFSISVAAAFTSLHFLRRVPDVPVEKIVQNVAPLPWKEMFFHPPFFKYIRYNVIINMALGASTAFWVRYFKAFLNITESNVLFIACGTNIVLVAALFLITPMIDRTGNKQVLTLSGILLTLHFMGIVPVMGRSHFLALYSVASNLTLGIVPLIWGPVMDGLDHWHQAWGCWNWNSYSLLYAVLTLTMMTGVVVLQTLDEPKKMTWDVFMSELLVKTPSRAVSRLIGRLRGPGIQ